MIKLFAFITQIIISLFKSDFNLFIENLLLKKENAIAERFVRSIHSESLDNFILLNQKQISKIIADYVEYYNSMRPHQGISTIPKGKPPDLSLCSHRLRGSVASKPVLGGLHHHYFLGKSHEFCITIIYRPYALRL